MSLIYLVTLSLILILKGHPIYATSDDKILSDLASGEYDGASTGRLVFIQPLVAQILKSLYEFNFNLNWYGVFLLIIVLSSLFAYKVTFNSKSLWQWYLISFLILFWFVLSPSYTATSLLSLVILLITFFEVLKSDKNSLIFLLTILICIASLIRIESLYGVLALLSFYIFYVIKKGLNLTLKKIKIVFVVVIATIFMNLFFQSIAQNKQWDKYDSWNNVRHQIQHREAEKRLPEKLQDANWTSTEYHLFVDLAFADSENFDQEWIVRGFAATSDYRGISGFFNSFTQANVVEIGKLIRIYDEILIIFLVVVLLDALRRRITFAQILMYLFISFGPFIFILFYLQGVLHTPERAIVPILITPFLLLINLFKTHELKNHSIFLKMNAHILLSGLIALIVIINSDGILVKIEENQIKINNLEKLKVEILNFNETGIYIIPANSDIFFQQNPYFRNHKSDVINYVTVGNWETFSPPWYNRIEHYSKKSENPYLLLLSEPKFFWLANDIPDVTLHVKNYLLEAYGMQVEYERVLETQFGPSVYKFSNN